MRERGEWYKDREKCIKESRIQFPDPMLMTLDTPHGPITKFLKKMPEKLDHNSGLHAKKSERNL